MFHFKLMGFKHKFFKKLLSEIEIEICKQAAMFALNTDSGKSI